MRITRAPKGTEVILFFDDHVEDGDKPMKCIVRGKLISRGPKFVTVESWSCVGDKETNAGNNKTFTILTSCVRGYCIVNAKWIGEDPYG